MPKHQHAALRHLPHERLEPLGDGREVHVPHRHAGALGHQRQGFYCLLELLGGDGLAVKAVAIERIIRVADGVLDDEAHILLDEVAFFAVQQIHAVKSLFEAGFEIVFGHGHSVTLHSPPSRAVK